MAQQVTINQITNAAVYLDGVSLLGKAAEIKLPDLSFKMADHQALGMVGDLELPAGIEKLSGTVKWNAYYQEVMRRAANPFTALHLQCRSSLETWGGGGRQQQSALVTFMTVTFKKLPTGDFKPRASAEFQSEFSCTYIKQMVDGVENLEYDALANIFRVDGVDLLAQYRANIGASV